MSQSGEFSGQQPRSEVAKQEASAVTDTVSEQTSAVTGAVQEGGQKVVSEAKAQAGQLAQEAQSQFQDMLGRSQTELTSRAAEQTDQAATSLHGVSQQLRAIAEGRPDEAPKLVGYIHQGADQLEQYAGRLESGGVTGVVEDVGRFARRKPGTFLVAAMAAGFAAGRLLRGKQAASSDSPTPSRSVTQTGDALRGPTWESPEVVTPVRSSLGHSSAAPGIAEPVTTSVTPAAYPSSAPPPDSDPLVDILPKPYLSGGSGQP